jgi:hypothetical protein
MEVAHSTKLALNKPFNAINIKDTVQLPPTQFLLPAAKATGA